MKKISILVILIAITIPQVASAAWWNPFSWSIFHRKDTRTEVLEKRIKELESKMNNVAASTTPTNPLKNPEVKRVDTTSKTNSQTNSPAIKESVPTSNINPAPTQTKPTSSSVDRDVLLSDLINKYASFESLVISEMNGLKKNSTLASERQYFAYMDSILNKVRADLGYLYTIKNMNPRPVAEEIYASKFSKLKSEYAADKLSYSKTLDEERAVEERNAPLREKEAQADARKNSPECLDAKQVLSDIESQMKPLEEVENKRHDEFVRTGKNTTPALSSSDSSKLATLSVRRSGALSNYFYECEGVTLSPSKIQTTNCYNTILGITCTTQ